MIPCTVGQPLTVSPAVWPKSAGCDSIPIMDQSSWVHGLLFLPPVLSSKVLGPAGLTSSKRSSGFPEAKQGVFRQKPPSGLGAKSEQGNLTGGQCEPLLPGTEQVFHMHSRHTTQLQTLQGTQ